MYLFWIFLYCAWCLCLEMLNGLLADSFSPFSVLIFLFFFPFPWMDYLLVGRRNLVKFVSFDLSCIVFDEKGWIMYALIPKICIFLFFLFQTGYLLQLSCTILRWYDPINFASEIGYIFASVKVFLINVSTLSKADSFY